MSIDVRRGPVSWPNILAALSTDDVLRSVVLTAYFDAGHDADSFARDRTARMSMMTLLSQAEDSLESTYPRRSAERDALRSLRRRLELEDR